jgi:hypothetical protein
LNRNFPWIPNAEQVRPTPEIKEKKHAIMKHIEEDWLCLDDYILNSIFEKSWKLDVTGKKCISQRDITGQCRFLPNEFPYNIAVGNHYVLWCGPQHDGSNLSEKCVNKRLNETISRMIKDVDSDDYDFAWYENPKMTVPDVYHVQVFWTLL